jgi:hypothetical protein
MCPFTYLWGIKKKFKKKRGKDRGGRSERVQEDSREGQQKKVRRREGEVGDCQGQTCYNKQSHK